jgi:hypothetical protein
LANQLVPLNGNTLGINVLDITQGQAPVQLVSIEGGAYTYTACFTAFAPVAAPTDIIQLVGAAGKLVHVTRVRLSGTSTSAVETTKDILGVLRSSLSTGGATATALTAAPHRPSAPKAQAVASSISSANWTTLGTSLGNIRADKYTCALATELTALEPSASIDILEWNFGTNNEMCPILENANQQFCINMNAIALVGTLAFDGSITWAEYPA